MVVLRLGRLRLWLFAFDIHMYPTVIRPPKIVDRTPLLWGEYGVFVVSRTGRIIGPASRPPRIGYPLATGLYEMEAGSGSRPYP